MKNRTVVPLSAIDDLWAVTEEWAEQHAFELICESETMRTYRSLHQGFLLPALVQLDQSPARPTLTAYVRMSRFDRALTLWTTPAEMGVESGGFKGMLSRDIARKKVNALLLELGQAEIA